MCARIGVGKGRLTAPVTVFIALAASLAGCRGLPQNAGQLPPTQATSTGSLTATTSPPTATAVPSATLHPSPIPPTATPIPSPTTTAATPLPQTPAQGTLRAPITDPDAARLTVHKSGVMCLAGPGAEFPVVQFFLPYYGFPFYFDPTGERTVVHEYPVIARHFSDQLFSRGWWWKIDRGDEGEACWVKQPPDLTEGGRTPYLEFVSLSGDIESVTTE